MRVFPCRNRLTIEIEDILVRGHAKRQYPRHTRAGMPLTTSHPQWSRAFLPEPTSVSNARTLPRQRPTESAQKKIVNIINKLLQFQYLPFRHRAIKDTIVVITPPAITPPLHLPKALPRHRPRPAADPLSRVYWRAIRGSALRSFRP